MLPSQWHKIKKCDKEHIKNWIIPMLPFQWHKIKKCDKEHIKNWI